MVPDPAPDDPAVVYSGTDADNPAPAVRDGHSFPVPGHPAVAAYHVAAFHLSGIPLVFLHEMQDEELLILLNVSPDHLQVLLILRQGRSAAKLLDDVSVPRLPHDFPAIPQSRNAGGPVYSAVSVCRTPDRTRNRL